MEMCFLDEWTWHMTVKYNSLYEVKHHRNIVWYCKANFKTNISRLGTRSRKSYSYSFKCINCKGEHQADSNLNTLKYGRMMSITQKNIFQQENLRDSLEEQKILEPDELGQKV